MRFFISVCSNFKTIYFSCVKPKIDTERYNQIWVRQRMIETECVTQIMCIWCVDFHRFLFMLDVFPVLSFILLFICMCIFPAAFSVLIFFHPRLKTKYENSNNNKQTKKYTHCPVFRYKISYRKRPCVFVRIKAQYHNNKKNITREWEKNISLVFGTYNQNIESFSFYVTICHWIKIIVFV